MRHLADCCSAAYVDSVLWQLAQARETTPPRALPGLPLSVQLAEVCRQKLVCLPFEVMLRSEWACHLMGWKGSPLHYLFALRLREVRVRRPELVSVMPHPSARCSLALELCPCLTPRFPRRLSHDVDLFDSPRPKRRLRQDPHDVPWRRRLLVLRRRECSHHHPSLLLHRFGAQSTADAFVRGSTSQYGRDNARKRPSSTHPSNVSALLPLYQLALDS